MLWRYLRMIAVEAKVEGTIRAINFKVNSTLSSTQVVMRLDASQQANQLLAAESQLHTALPMGQIATHQILQLKQQRLRPFVSPRTGLMNKDLHLGTGRANSRALGRGFQMMDTIRP